MKLLAVAEQNTGWAASWLPSAQTALFSTQVPARTTLHKFLTIPSLIWKGLRAWSTRIETHQALPTFELVNVKVRRVIVFRHCNFSPNSSPVCSGSVMIYRVVCSVDSDFSCWQTSWRTKVLQELLTVLPRLKSKLRSAAPLKQASRQNC